MTRFWAICLGLFLLISGPVRAEIILSPGDEVFIQVPGEKAFLAPFKVEDNGKILLPEIGAIMIAGLTEKQAESMVKRRLALVYRNLDQYSLTLKGHKIRIKILGLVNRPGQVSLKSNSNIQMAITAAGGLKPGAQLDKLQLKTPDRNIIFNYKAYLNTGDNSLIPTLKSGYTIFIPASPLMGNVELGNESSNLFQTSEIDRTESITIFGELISPGTFAYEPNINIVDALMLAGGVTRYADVSKIRVVTNNSPYQFDLRTYLDSGGRERLPPLNSGSTIFVPVEVKDIGSSDNNIYVMGEVKSPGAYENSKSAGFVDVLANAGGPTRFADTTQIRILKKSRPSVVINLVEYTKSPQKFRLPILNPGDVIFVPEKTDMNEKSWLKITNDRAIRILGAVGNPGRFEWDDNMGFLDLLAHAGGPEERANISEIKIIKNGNQNNPKNVTLFNLQEFIEEGGDFNDLPELRAGDTIIIDELPRDPTDNKASWIRQSADSSIYVFGEVGAPGRYAFNDKLGFLDILGAADGPSDAANLRQIRISHRDGAGTRVTKVNLALYFETGDESLLPRVVPGDVIYIPGKDSSDWIDKPSNRVVRLMGAVNKPGRYSFTDQMSVLDLLAEAGGPTEIAYIEKIMIVNTTCCSDEGRIFNLHDYVSSPSQNKLPILRPGDTVYVPDKEHSSQARWRQGLMDAVSVVSLILLGTNL